jgi:DNA (cytosine-5)-methyltransferase 1
MKNLHSSSAVVHETVVRLGEQRGQPRYFVNARYLARAGFQHGQWLSIKISEGSITLAPTDAPTGKKVQEKNGHPLIDLNAKFLKQVFGEAKTLHVRVSQEQITLSVHCLATAKTERLRDGSMGSVFSGAGLLDQAGVEVGFKTRWAVEIDRKTADVFADNHPEATIYEMSAHEAAFSNLAPVELLVMGLPCQPWSRARTLNSDGSRVDRTRPATEHALGDMAFWAFMIAARCNPRTIVLECAPAFKDGEVWASFSGALRRLGYVVDSRVLSATDAGALTKRKRTVMVAMTPDADGSVANPWPAAPAEGTALPTAADILDKNVPDELWWGRAEKAWIFEVNERNAAKGSGFGFQVVRPESTSMGTLTAEYGETKNDQPVVAHPTKPDTYRFFTLTEGRKLFGLPEHYRLPEAKTVAWRLLGQAVYIPLFVAVIRQATTRVRSLLQEGTAPAFEFALTS